MRENERDQMMANTREVHRDTVRERQRQRQIERERRHQ